jgi:hypothetical protein
VSEVLYVHRLKWCFPLIWLLDRKPLQCATIGRRRRGDFCACVIVFGTSRSLLLQRGGIYKIMCTSRSILERVTNATACRDWQRSGNVSLTLRLSLGRLHASPSTAIGRLTREVLQLCSTLTGCRAI